MPGIFISYRREDSSAYAGRLYDHLASHFGKESVFIDVGSLKPGVDYLDVVQRRVRSCDALVAVIGKQWLSAGDEEGRRRLDDPEDLVRLEIAAALERGILVVPTLVAGAQMPRVQDLPEVLASLSRRNALEISDLAFHESVSRLIETLKRESDSARPAPPPGEPGGKTVPRPARRRWVATVGIAAAVVGLVLLGSLFYSRKAHALTEKDTIVLADFSNATGDAVFDDTLKQGLATELQQSPFLNILSDQKVRATLRLMGRSAADRLEPEAARDLCERTRSKAFVSGSIANLGSQYVIGLNVINCQNGDALAKEQMTAKSKERVLEALDEGATKLREKLGESLSSVREFDTPLMSATTPSLEALKAYSVGIVKDNVSDAEAIPFFKRAIELDPNFASAYESLGVCYSNLGEAGQAAENITKAYALRERVSEREKLRISAHYYESVTGEIQKAIQTRELLAATYPRNSALLGNLGVLYGETGQFEKAVTKTSEAIRLDPDASPNYANLVLSYAALNRFEDAKEAYKQEQTRKIEDPLAKVNRFGIAFVEGDTAEMEQLMAWSAGKPGEEDIFLSAKADTEAFSGHVSKAREFSRRAVESALRNEQKETAAQWQMEEAIWEAEFGNRELARQLTSAALARTTNRDTQILAAIALARAGDAAQAEKIANQLEKRFPLDTLIKEYWLPIIRASIDLDRKDAAGAIGVLEAASPYELASPQTWSGLGGPLYPAYLRGLAYLVLRQGKEAAAEFQRPIDHPGFMLACPLRTLAHFGVARGYAVQGETAKSRAAFQEFFAFWKDADPDIPILKQAKAEYAKLQ